MKNFQRSFAVEYKSDRRKPDARPSSIWGNIDLKSAARDVEKSAMPFRSDSVLDEESRTEVPLPKANRVLPILTPPVDTSKTVADAQEMFMADDTNTTTNADASAVAETPVAPKKQRRPRTKNASPEIAAADAAKTDVGQDSVGGRKKRGRDAKVIGGATLAKRTPVKRAPVDTHTATNVAASAGDEMQDLLQLEEENQKLRKLLAEKLRSENADLRKKLKLD